MRVHACNYRVRGYTKSVDLPQLVELGRKHNLTVIDDAGSGQAIDLTPFGLPGEPLISASITEGADLAIGSRYVPGGATPDWPLQRRLISKGGNFYARTMLGIPIRDATAGYRAYRRDALERLPYREAEASGYGFQVEMAWRAVSAGLGVVEVPISFKDRTRGTSKMNSAIVAEAMRLVTVWGVRRIWRALPFTANDR